MVVEAAAEVNVVPPGRRDRPSRVGHRGRAATLAVVFALGSLFFLWTIATSGSRADFNGDPPDYYAELTTGFLHGELSIPTPAPKGLVDLPDPDSPAQNGPFQAEFHDLALYHGRLYLDWGPTPVVTLYLPWRLLHLGDIPESWALWIYSSLGLGFVLLLLGSLVEIYAPGARTTRVAFGAFALGFGSVVPFIDRTPDVYEVAVSSAYCFLTLGLYLLASGGLGGRRSLWRLAFGSLSLGLAAGARWDLLLAALLLPPLLVWLVRRDEVASRRERTRLAVVVLGPCAACVLSLLAYNYARFGSPLEVGTSYQLAGFNPRTTPYYLIGYLWPSLYYYLVAPVRFTLLFPFVALPPPPSYPGGVPPSYAPEIIGGIFTIAPILLMLFAAPFVGRRRGLSEWRWAVGVLVVVTVGIVALLSLGVPGGSMRYEVDFATFILVPAVLTFILWEPRRRWLRRMVGTGGAVLIVYGTLVAIGISIDGYHRQVFQTAAGQMSVLEHATQPMANFVTTMLGHPVLISGGCDGGFVSTARYNTLGIGNVVFGVMSEGLCSLEILGPHSGTWTISASTTPVSPLTVTPTRPAYLVVHDASGTRRYPYAGAPTWIALRVSLRPGPNLVTFSVAYPALPHLAANQALIYFSDLKVAGPEDSG